MRQVIKDNWTAISPQFPEDICHDIFPQLNVVYLEDVFEDEKSVHMIMELCKGGELLHNLGKKHYSEGTVSTIFSFLKILLCVSMMPYHYFYCHFLIFHNIPHDINSEGIWGQ
jgi:serine/threonine protein kinase